MINSENLLKLAENLILTQTNTYCSDLHKSILSSTLRGERKTYEQLADEHGYSPKYIKNDIAPKLWHYLSVAVGQKVTKSNARAILEEQMGPNRNLSASIVEHSVSPKGATTPFTNLLPHSTSNKPSRLTRASILLVDDEPQNLRLLSELLEEQNYKVRQAMNGEIAIKAISLATPDLILLDILMPELDGYSVCQKLKSNPETRDIPVIFISALDEPWDKVKAFTVGGVDYINKPFKVVEVLARIENQLKIQQLQKELKVQNAKLQKALLKLKQLAGTDSLTQVSSRERFDEYLVFNWHQESETRTSLSSILCEIDQLDRDKNSSNKYIKKQLLFQVAQIIKKIVQRPEDLIARYEDTTFGIILPNLEIEKSEQIARTLLEQVQKAKIPALAGSSYPTVTLSIAMATICRERTMPLETFVDLCERALERAKSEGGNGYVLVEG